MGFRSSLNRGVEQAGAAMRCSQKICARAWFLLVALAASGCGDSDALNSPTALKMKGLANAYLDYVVGAGGNAPADEGALKKHMLGLRASVQYDCHIDPNNIESSFVSQRDKEPLVVIYGQAVGTISGNSKQVIAHEKTGTNGKRLVAFVSTKVDIVDEAELERLKSAEGKDKK
jgi:hypothetical protein